MRDPLTGLANSRLLREMLTRSLAQAARSRGGGIALISADVDRFKEVNDQYGHPTGDRVLRGVADRFQLATRPADLVARVGGDEFIVLCAQGTTRQQARRLADRIREMTAAPIPVDRKVLRVGVSVAVRWCPAEGADVETILRGIDRALYRTKRKRAGAVQESQSAT